MPGYGDPGLAMAQSMMSEELKKQFAPAPTTYALPGQAQTPVVVKDQHSFDQAEIENWFTYHAPSAEQLHNYSAIRHAAKMLAETINRNVPAGPDKSAAMRKLRETVMTANAGIACFQERKRPTIDELEKILQKQDDTPVHINPDGSITTEPQE